jgi:transposase
MIGAMARHRVQVLRASGMTLRRIATETGIPLRSVRRIVRERAIEQPSDAASARERGVGRPSIVQPFEGHLVALLEAEPKLPTVEVLHRMRGVGYDGAKSALYEAVRRLRPRPIIPLVRFEGVPGEFSQHDFGEVDVRYLDGGKERIHFFASRLKYSRWVDVQLVEDERVEALVRSLLAGFASFGGVPLVSVFDNPKTITLGREAGQILWNETFAQVALDYGFGVELCTPSRAQEKGSVENLVGFVKGSFFKVRRFHDRADLVQQLAEWHHQVNEVRPCRATRVTPAERIAAERARLRPLAIDPDEYPLRFPVLVGPTGLVDFEGNRYSMAPESIGLPGTLWLYLHRVRIIAGRFASEHSRVPECGRTPAFIPNIAPRGWPRWPGKGVVSTSSARSFWTSVPLPSRSSPRSCIAIASRGRPRSKSCTALSSIMDLPPCNARSWKQTSITSMEHSTSSRFSKECSDDLRSRRDAPPLASAYRAPSLSRAAKPC